MPKPSPSYPRPSSNVTWRNNIKLVTEQYLRQKESWPSTGRHILAQYTDEYIVVYQAYRPSKGLFAVEHQYFGGEFSYSRMSWIKPNFLWMMYRSGWGTKADQEVVLAIKLKIDYFNSILENAVSSSFDPDRYNNEEDWKAAKSRSSVRLQWDPDHSPKGGKLERRAIQLGLKNDFLLPFQGEGIVEIEDISEFVAAQRQCVLSGNIDELYTPLEKLYLPGDGSISAQIGLDNI